MCVQEIFSQAGGNLLVFGLWFVNVDNRSMEFLFTVTVTCCREGIHCDSVCMYIYIYILYIYIYIYIYCMYIYIYIIYIKL